VPSQVVTILHGNAYLNDRHLTAVTPGSSPVSEIKAIHELCRQITEEKDSAKAQLMISELRNILAVNSDETRLRLRFVAKVLNEMESKLDSDSSSAA
jgi:hypothetical protein